MRCYAIQTMLRCMKRWNRSPRLFLVLFMIICMVMLFIHPFVENARAQGEPLQIGELFAILTNWRFALTFMSSTMMLLFCDLPVLDGYTVKAIIKGNRRSWYIGQVLYVFAVSVGFATLLWVTSGIMAFPDVTTINQWSKSIRLISTTGRIAIDPSRFKMVFDAAIINMGSPMTVATHSYFLLILLGCVYGLSTLVLRMYIEESGFLILLVSNIIAWVASMFSVGEKGYVIFSALSLHYHASFYLHDNVLHNNGLATLNQSYSILTAICFLMLIAGMGRLKQIDFAFHEEVAE